MVNLLNIQPQEPNYPGKNYPVELKKEASCSIRLSNNTHNHVAFKVQTTSPGKYKVEPRNGVISPSLSLYLKVTQVGPVEDPFQMQCKDKFLIISAVAAPRHKPEDAGNFPQACKLGVVYILQSGPDVEESTSFSRTDSSTFEASEGKLLDIHPSDLRFPVELKELSCSLILSNMTENNIAFKVKATDPWNYSVGPSCEIISPRSTCDITVSIKAKTGTPVETLCKGKFQIQSIIASSVATSKESIQKMFNEAKGVENLNFGVFYFFRSSPPSSNSEILEEVSSTNVSTLQERNLNGSEVLQGQERNRNHDLFRKSFIIIGLLIICYLVMNMLLLSIWSYTFVITVLLMNIVKNLVSNSVEDWMKQVVLSICLPWFKVISNFVKDWIVKVVLPKCPPRCKEIFNKLYSYVEVLLGGEENIAAT